jgi:hypothetical protein
VLKAKNLERLVKSYQPSSMTKDLKGTKQKLDEVEAQINLLCKERNASSEDNSSLSF